MAVSLAGEPSWSRKSGPGNDSKRTQTVTRVPRVTNDWPGLTSVLTILWIVASSRLGSVFLRRESGFARFLRNAGRLGCSLIRYRSSSAWSLREPHRLGQCSRRKERLEARSRLHRRRTITLGTRSFHGVEPPDDIPVLTAALRRTRRRVAILV